MGAACNKHCCKKKTDDQIVDDEFSSPQPEPEPIKLTTYTGTFGGVPPVGYIDPNKVRGSGVMTTEITTLVVSETLDPNSANMLKRQSRIQSIPIANSNPLQQSRYSNPSNSQYAHLEKNYGQAAQRNIKPNIVEQTISLSPSMSVPNIVINLSDSMTRDAQKASNYNYAVVNNQRNPGIDPRVNISSIQSPQPLTNTDPNNFSIYQRLESADGQESKLKLQQSRSALNFPSKFKPGSLNYIGAWKGQLKHGLGTQTWPDGSVYEGNWVEGKACGHGKFKLPNGDILDGQFNNDMANGRGILMRHDGSRYEGTWWDDMQHGTGIETWYNGSKYEGCYHKGKKHGYGRYVWPDKSQYTGDWQGNTITGYGRMIWSDGRKYDGQFLNNQKHGSGRHFWPDGRKYEGDYRMDKRHGHGKLILPDGSMFIGQWQDNKRNGRGIESAPNGGSREGTWAYGNLTNWIT